MIEIYAQWNGKTFFPYSDKDQEEARGFKPNQIVRLKCYGAEKPRSYIQLRLYWACAKTVSENHPQDLTRDDVDFEVKIKVAKHYPSMIRRFKSVDGTVFMEPISIAYRNMKHLEACNFFDRAFPIMAEMIGVTKEELLQNSAMSQT